MYAILKTGGKQYKVSEGDVIKVEKEAPVFTQCNRLSRIILGDRVFEQGIDGVQSVLCHCYRRFCAYALVLFEHHLTIELLSDN